jgi:hypothetical protein
VLTPEQREVWLQVFYVWLMIRFENSLEELSKMVFAAVRAACRVAPSTFRRRSDSLILANVASGEFCAIGFDNRPEARTCHASTAKA